MNHHMRWILVVLANLLLILLVAELNHFLAIWSLHVYLVGLLMIFAVLNLKLKESLLANGLTGLFLEVTSPLPFGTIFLLIVVCHTVAFSLRGNFSRGNLRSVLTVAASLNVTLMLVLGILSVREVPSPGIYWARIGVDALLSTVALAAVAPWFLSLQSTALAFVGLNPDAEAQEGP